MVALVTIASYGIMSISYNMLGFAAHATHFVTLFVALGIFFYVKFYESKSWLFAGLTGIALGFAFLMKQQAVFFLIMGGLLVIDIESFKQPIKWMNKILTVGAYSIGVFIPYILVILIMVSSGNFDKFWFWTVEYASKYAASGLSIDDAKQMFGMSFKPMFDEFIFIWLLGFAGILFVWLSKYDLQKKLFATYYMVIAFACVCPGFYFRQHYFIVWLPAVGLMAALTLDYFANLITTKLNLAFFKILPIIIVSLVGIMAVVKNKPYYTKVKPMQLCKMIYGTNPFVESVEIADYIKKNTDENDKIAVLGSEPQIFVYSDRQSATGHIYTYGLMEIHDYNKTMQKEMISEIEREKPKYIVYCNVRFSWLPRPGSVTGTTLRTGLRHGSAC